MGHEQQNSQELLAFLLDGLHEGPNRILKKPNTENPDATGRPDEEVANEAWHIHKARNDSFIVDLFQGQLKMTVVCSECSKVSVTFDPFMYLTLPLLDTTKWIGAVIFVSCGSALAAFHIRIQLPAGSTIRQMKERVATLVTSDTDCLFVVGLLSGGFGKSCGDTDALDEILDSSEIVVCELLTAGTGAVEESVIQNGIDLSLSGPRGPPMIDTILQDEFALVGTGDNVTLDDCFKEYMRQGRFGKIDAWFCPVCRKHRLTSNNLDIWRLPDVLIVHLKPFISTPNRSRKTHTLVDFPIHGLDLSSTSLSKDEHDDVYDLFGVSNHKGGLVGGHYTTYVKNEKQDQWYLFDDSKVTSALNEEAIKTAEAYLLFYRRRSSAVCSFPELAAQTPLDLSRSQGHHIDLDSLSF
ncbi:hypothetical protein BGZ93_007436 [Podila epicladia]|nr:hypothetical protein BGZ93_007436 [Podila epicladia]